MPCTLQSKPESSLGSLNFAEFAGLLFLACVGRADLMRTRVYDKYSGSMKLRLTWIILVIVQQHLIFFSGMHGPTEYHKYLPRLDPLHGDPRNTPLGPDTEPNTPHPKPFTPSPKLSALNLEPSTLNLEPWTLDPQP